MAYVFYGLNYAESEYDLRIYENNYDYNSENKGEMLQKFDNSTIIAKY